VNGYINDVLLILEACAITYRQGHKLDLIISGPCNDASRIRLLNKARELEYPPEKLRLLGYISEEELAGYCRNAFCFIIPLWNSQKSFYRFPTKLASFMFCGRPVLTAQIGEVGEILTDGKDTLFFEPGNATDLAVKIEILFRDPALYEQICMNTRSFAEKQFNYSVYELPLKQFFTTVIDHS
jgi:glycosyltransferase involved in cell wall biosynthesis